MHILKYLENLIKVRFGSWLSIWMQSLSMIELSSWIFFD
jgi:hypothetical protein